MGKFISALTAIVLGSATPALAYVETGVFPPGYSDILYGHYLGDDTTFRVSLQTSAPLSYSDLMFDTDFIFTYYNDDGTVYLQDDQLDVFDIPLTALTPTSLVAQYTTPAEEKYYYPDGHISEDDYYLNYGFELDVDTAVDPTSYVFEVSMVPEPATWVLMLVGVGAAGATLRGSRRPRASA